MDLYLHLLFGIGWVVGWVYSGMGCSFYAVLASCSICFPRSRDVRSLEGRSAVSKDLVVNVTSMRYCIEARSTVHTFDPGEIKLLVVQEIKFAFGYDCELQFCHVEELVYDDILIGATGSCRNGI